MNTRELEKSFAAALAGCAGGADVSASELVGVILREAALHRVSDVHLTPEETFFRMQWRIDGVLHLVAGFASELGPRLVARLKVISGLLTYRTDLPQEGRVASEFSAAEVRVSTFPTLFGEKVAIRLFGENSERQLLSQLGLSEAAEQCLRQQLQSTSGVLLVTGPSSSGKTTTAYALVREILRQSGGARCVMTIEDPVESAIPGAAQSQVRPAAGFDLATGLKSLMRQDPDVILVGEIRDPATAEATFQAALTGHLVIATFHAGSAVEALARLLEMGLEPFLICSALQMVTSQRLLRRRCGACWPAATDSAEIASSSDKRSNGNTPVGQGCTCGGTGYAGRIVLCESLAPSLPGMTEAILRRADVRALAEVASACGTLGLRELARLALLDGVTSREELLRVFGGFSADIP